MRNKGLFCSLFLDGLKKSITLDDAAQGRLATLAQTWRNRDVCSTEALWETFLKQALGYLEFVPPQHADGSGVYPLYEDWSFNRCMSVLYLTPPGADIDDTAVGRFYPAKLLAQVKKRRLNWGILTDGDRWRLYSAKSSRPYEDYVELSLATTLETWEESEYGLFERFFHKDSFVTHRIVAKAEGSISEDADEDPSDVPPAIEKCRLDQDREQSESVLEQYVKDPFLAQVDEALQYICNGFIFATQKSGEEYTEEERAEIFENAVKLIYRCVFLFYAEARRLLPTDPEKIDLYHRHSMQALCTDARRFRWGKRYDLDQYDLWKHLKGLINAVNDGDPEYGIMGYNGGLFDDEEERFLGKQQLRNDFLARALYLLAYVEPYNNEPDSEYAIPYEDLEVRHLGELYENILEFTVQLADADRIRRRTKKGTEILLASQTIKRPGDTYIRKGEVFFGESALERKQTGSYYTAESLVRFLNEKSIVQPLRETFEHRYRSRFNDLLEQATKGHDASTRRGAAQSAAALVERFAEQEVLDFKICDPAMGSGHFLVDTSNQMAGLVVSLLEEVPDMEGLTVSTTSHPNYWRRRITRHCIYGVDLNPLAVNLSKLSLWLNCFAGEHKLTFLDHHLYRGNSLIGIRSLKQIASIPKRRNDRRDNASQELLLNYDDLSSVLAHACRGISSITDIDEDDTDSQREVLRITRDAASDLVYLADLYTAYLMDSSISAGTYKELFEKLAGGKAAITSLNSSLMGAFASVMEHRITHQFFHWPLEFPDVFEPGAPGGFSAIVGNPPWDIVKPNSQEFFSDYDPSFRSYKKQEANRVAQKLMSDNPLIAEKWQRYCRSFVDQSAYFREPLSYSALGGGDINTYKIFLEQFFNLLTNDGRMGIVVPSGIYTDQGCQPLRELFFSQGQVGFLYCFENRWPAVFTAVDGRFKFVLFSTKKGGTTDQFKCAFMEHDPERLPIINANAYRMSVDHVKRFSPDTLSLMEFRNQRDIDVTSRIYDSWPLLGERIEGTWNAEFRQELNVTSDSHLFKTTPTNCPLYEGKMIWLYDSEFEKPRFWLDRREVEKAVGGRAWEGDHYRVGFRNVGASTNERTLICGMIPPSYHGNSIQSVTPRYQEWNGPNNRQAIWATSILSSICIDYLIRKKVSMNINFFYIESLPIPRENIQKLIEEAIIARSTRLLCANSMFRDLWTDVFNSEWQLSTFWYADSAPINAYGPVHEREIRQRLGDEAKNLTPEWGPRCGVHDRLPDRRDTGDRAQLRAEIDAYVAHLYGLSLDDFAYILDAFPVLKRKEEKAFGEFMSKRKCLEEYDRLTKILGEKE